MGRKIILSRKGFDSGYGGMASAFVEGGEMVSFPIPNNPAIGEGEDTDVVDYDNLSVPVDCDNPSGGKMSLRDRIRMLKSEKFASKFGYCHHDPDLRRGIFGQSGIAQAHLCRHVGEGDLFLFFGWFRQAAWDGDSLRFLDSGRDVQALFGFLQIGEGGILPARIAAQKYPDFRDHPHMTPSRLKWDNTPRARELLRANNTIYVAAERLSLPDADDLPGHGVFRHSPDVILTAKRADSRTIWNLPPKVFRNREITYHTKKNPWRPDGLFESRPRGQEFVVHDDENETVSKWAADLINRHCLPVPVGG